MQGLMGHIKLIPPHQEWNQFRKRSLFPQFHLCLSHLVLEYKDVGSEEKLNDFKIHDGTCRIEFCLELITISQATNTTDMSVHLLMFS